MALTEDQITDCLLLLDLPVRVEEAYKHAVPDGERYRDASVARKLLESLAPAQEAKVGAILTQYADIEFDTDALQAEGLDSKASRTRARLSRMLANLIGFQRSGGGFRLMRG